MTFVRLAAGLALAALLALPAAPAFAAPAAAPAAPAAPATATDGKVTVKNTAPITLRELYSSPAGANAFGEDILGDSVLATGATKIVQATPPGGPCLVDLRGVLTNGAEVFHRAVNVCASASFEFTAPPELARDEHDRRVVIGNMSRARLTGFYYRAAGTTGPDWGVNRIPGGLAFEGTQRLNIDNGDTACEFDFKAIFEGGRTVVREGVNACNISNYRFGDPGAGSGDGQDRKVNITNDTDRPMTGLGFTVTGREAWRPLNVPAPVAPGGKIRLEFDDGEGHCAVDIRATFASGDPMVQRNVNVCRVADLAIVAGENAGPPDEREGGGEDGDSDEGENDRGVAVTNKTGMSLTGLAVALPGTTAFGDNLLESPIASRANSQLEITNGTDACEFDVKATFEGGRTIVASGFNACRASSLNLYDTPRGLVASDDENRWVWVFNYTDKPLTGLCLAGPGLTSCARVTLPGRLAPGQSAYLNLTDGTARCEFDIRATFAGGPEKAAANVNVCRVSEEEFED